MDDYNDSYPTCQETHASVRIFSRSHSSDEISTRLGIAPSKTSLRADAVTAYGGDPRSQHGWLLKSDGRCDSRDLRRHIDWLLDILEPAKDQLAQLVEEGARADVNSYWSSKHGHGGPILSPCQMKRLADLNLALGIDIYFPRGAD